jgi:hypothetical protein
LKEALCVSVGDCAYSDPNCLSEAQKNLNQVHISRARNNRNFYYPFEEEPAGPKKRGRPKEYGEKHQLKDEESWHEPDEQIEFQLPNKKGEIQTVHVQCWNNLIMRGNRKSNMSDHPFRLLRVQIYNASGNLVFKRPLWLIASGDRKNELGLQEIVEIYRQRFDLEHFFRFGKNRLLMDKAQTSDTNHEEVWWQLTMISYAQLYLSRHISKHVYNPWEKTLPVFKSSGQEKSPTQVQKDFERIIQEIGTPALAPKPRKNSPGRKIGELQTKRRRHSIVCKKQKATKKGVVPT